MNRATAQSKTREKINRITGGEGFNTIRDFSTWTSVYYTHLHELPDRVRNYPESCQRAYLVTFNNNLRRFKNHGYAAKAAWTALERMHDKWLHDQQKAKRYQPGPQDIARQIIEKAKPLRPQIVVA